MAKCRKTWFKCHYTGSNATLHDTSATIDGQVPRSSATMHDAESSATIQGQVPRSSATIQGQVRRTCRTCKGALGNAPSDPDRTCTRTLRHTTTPPVWDTPPCETNRSVSATPGIARRSAPPSWARSSRTARVHLHGPLRCPLAIR